MQTSPKIIKATAFSDRTIEIYYSSGEVGSFNFENYFDYLGLYDFLEDVSEFAKVNVDPYGHNIFWLNPKTNEEIELDPSIMYSIISQQKIIVNEKVVFDPSLGKAGWL
jgi:hypothetical protein